MQRNRYKSHERNTGNTWFSVWDQELALEQGRIEIEGTKASGYRILRRGRLYGSGRPSIVFGDGGIYFEKRKDAENFALILAMHFSGDLAAQDFLDPTIFNGTQSGKITLSHARMELFWRGASAVDPSAGWSELDPGRILQRLVDPDELFPPEDDYGECDMRGFVISEAAEAVVKYYEEWFLTDKVDTPLHEVVATVLVEQAEECGEVVANEDRGYVTLLALARLRDGIPVNWLFPADQDNLIFLIPRLWSTLPEDVKAYLAEHEAQAVQARERFARVEILEQIIVSQLPFSVAEKNWELHSRICCCAAYFIDVLEGENEPPMHFEPDYRILMQQFADRAVVNVGNAIQWLASSLKVSAT